MQKKNFETKCGRIPKGKMEINGLIGEYISNITDNWLLTAPKVNPGMLEMFRDRDASPLRHMKPWFGEFAGKYLSSAVQTLRVNGDRKLKVRLKEFVEMLIGFQDDDGYLGAWPKTCHISNIDSNGELTWDTWSHYHIMLGLMLWNEETGDKNALQSAVKIADLICRKYSGKKDKRLVDTGSTEMNLAVAHSLCILYRKTSTRSYLDMAMQIVDEFSAMEEGNHLAGDYLEQALNGKQFFEFPMHRWESLHPVMALVELYWITGEDKYRKAFEQIWWSIVKLDRHNNGGFSSGEGAVGNPYNLGAIESCCTIAWTAMSVEMLKLTANSIVADELELTLINSIVGMHSSSGRWSTYDTPMNGVRMASAHHIVFQAREGSPELNCCSVNTPRGFGMLSDWALMEDEDGLIINYYGPSKSSASLKSGAKVTIEQKTEYPVDGKISIDVIPCESTEFTLKLRIPQWSKETTVTINGKKLSGIEAGTYLALQRKWEKSDNISLSLDMSLHFWHGERECEGLTSIYRGPILLTYDHRYNLENANEELEVRDIENWNPLTCNMSIPEIDAENIKFKKIEWTEWLSPLMLFELKTDIGKKVRLCDFGSAGEAGTPYCSWLPVKNLPEMKCSVFKR